MQKSIIPQVRVQWSKKHQSIEGVGTHAGRAEPFFIDKNRDDILAKLFGEDGLRLSIVRAEILHSWSPEKGVINFHLDANIDVTPGDPDFPTSSTDRTQRGQLWVLKKAKERFKVEKIIASTWTPPTYMKTIPGREEGNGGGIFHPINRLDAQYDDAFADYLARFAEEFARAGLPIYALSPMNEPEFPTPSWQGAVWLPTDTIRFVPKLKNALQKVSPDTKIIIGETANWNIADLYLASSLLLGGDLPVDVLASHGYSLPNFSGEVSYNTDPFPWLLTRSGLPRWITESSSTKPFDASMKTGMELAVSLHNFFARQSLSAFVFWLGMAGGKSNESLIRSDGENYYLAKVFDVLGQYSRYIRPGDVRIETSSDEPASGLYISAYGSPEMMANGNSRLAIVITNASEENKTLTLIPEGIYPQCLDSYVTTESDQWSKGTTEIPLTQGEFHLSLPAMSVTTLTNRPK